MAVLPQHSELKPPRNLEVARVVIGMRPCSPAGEPSVGRSVRKVKRLKWVVVAQFVSHYQMGGSTLVTVEIGEDA